MRVRSFLFFGALFLFLCSQEVVSQNIGKVLSLNNAIPIYQSQNKKGKKKKVNLEVIDHKYFKIGYLDKHKQSVWVAYLLTKNMVLANNSNRSNRFRMDKSLSTKSATSSDYTNSGYDRGHICPSADMIFLREAQDMTFLMSNISPQIHSFNGGKWKELEEKVRQWAIENDSIIVIAGPVLDSIIGVIGKNNVSIPFSFYKIIIDISYPDYKAIGFIMQNEKLDEGLIFYCMSIREVEERTGLNFFPKFNDNLFIQNLETKTFDWKLGVSNKNRIKKNKDNVKKIKTGD